MRFLPESPSFCAGRQAVKEAGASRQAAGKEAGREADMQAGSRQGGRQICMHAGRQAEQPWSPEDVPSRLLHHTACD